MHGITAALTHYKLLVSLNQNVSLVPSQAHAYGFHPFAKPLTNSMQEDISAWAHAYTRVCTTVQHMVKVMTMS